MFKHQMPNDIAVSKTISWILRHGAVKEHISISRDGFVKVQDILQHRNLKGKCNIDDLIRIVENNDKKRFTLRKSAEGILEIKAVQGHSLKVVDSLELTPLTSASEISNIIHGTYYRFWEKIKNEGLSRMSRNHIHFAPGLPKDGNVISGMRSNCDLYIYIDINLAISSGVTFYKSSNNVILSPGNDKGFIEPKYFEKVVDAKKDEIIFSNKN